MNNYFIGRLLALRQHGEYADTALRHTLAPWSVRGHLWARRGAADEAFFVTLRQETDRPTRRWKLEGALESTTLDAWLPTAVTDAEALREADRILAALGYQLQERVVHAYGDPENRYAVLDEEFVQELQAILGIKKREDGASLQAKLGAALNLVASADAAVLAEADRRDVIARYLRCPSPEMWTLLTMHPRALGVLRRAATGGHHCRLAAVDLTLILALAEIFPSEKPGLDVVEETLILLSRPGANSPQLPDRQAAPIREGLDEFELLHPRVQEVLTRPEFSTAMERLWTSIKDGSGRFMFPKDLNLAMCVRSEEHHGTKF